MDGESIFYIIVAVVYFAVSIMNSRKKARQKKEAKGQPKPKPSQQQAPARPEPTLEDVIGELFGGETKAPPAAPKPVVEPIDAGAFIRQQQQQLELQAKAARLRAQETKKKMNALNQKNIKKNREAVDAAKLLSKPGGKLFGSLHLREAIIAQTILDRPYK